MKQLTYLLIFSISILSISCVEELPTDNERFIKVFGKESGSFGSVIHETSDGSLVLGCKIDVPAFDYTNVGGNYYVGDVIEGSVALINADKNGHQTGINLYPIADHKTIPNLIFTDLSRRGLIDQVIPTDDGGYMVLGQWRGIGVSLFLPNDTLILDESDNITSPFLMKINSAMNIEFLRSANGEEGWDGTYYPSAKMRLLPNGNFGILTGKNIYDYDHSKFQGYSYTVLSQAGDSLNYYDYHAPTLDIKFAADFLQNDNGDLCLIGQVNNRLFLFILESGPDGTETWVFLDPSGMASGVPNTNPMFIEQFEDKSFVMVYTDPPQNTRIAFASSSYVARESKSISLLSDEYPRAVYITENEDILIYTEHLTKTTVPEGYLYRIHRNGTTKFRVRIEGTPGDVRESKDGTILVLSNPLFNGLIPKARLTKLSADGKIF